MTQPSLFDDEPAPGATPDAADRTTRARARARRTDPATSHAAAAAVEASGTVGRHEALILAALREKDGQTSEEIAAEAGLDRVACARRMKELERDGRVRRGEPRPSAGSKRPGITWWLATNEVRR